MDILSKKLKKNIIILGAGFAGVKCALDLEKLAKKDKSLSSNFNIVLIDKNNYHLYTPTLYEVASTAKADASGSVLKKVITTPIENIVKNKNIKFLQGEIIDIDFKKRTVDFSDQTVINFEYLVLALGSKPTYFGIEGLKEYSLSLKWLNDGIRIRNKIRNKFLEKRNGEEIKIIIGGSGPNGVEFSAELAGYIKELNNIYNKKIEANIKLIDGSSHILPGFEHNVVKKALKRLEYLNIKTINGFVILKVDKLRVYLKQLPPSNEPRENFTPEEKTEDYDILIWSGGVEANSLLMHIDMSKEKRGRIETNQFLGCLPPDKHLDVAKNIFAIGDNSCFYDPKTQRPVPGTAKIAIEQAKIAAKNIYNLINKKPKELYKIKPLPFAIPIGGKYALTKWGPFLFTGFTGWIIKQLIELYYLYSVTKKASVIFNWWRGIRIFSKND